jgi:DNA-binding transcriptional regulator YiaG
MNIDSKTLRKERLKKYFPNLIEIGNEIEKTTSELHQLVDLETVELKALIEQWGISQIVLADMLGISKQTFSNALNNRETKKGYSARFTVSQLNKINAHLLQLSESVRNHYDKWKD